MIFFFGADSFAICEPEASKTAAEVRTRLQWEPARQALIIPAKLNVTVSIEFSRHALRRRCCNTTPGNSVQQKDATFLSQDSLAKASLIQKIHTHKHTHTVPHDYYDYVHAVYLTILVFCDDVPHNNYSTRYQIFTRHQYILRGWLFVPFRTRTRALGIG